MIASTIIFHMSLDSDWSVLEERAAVRAKEYYTTVPGLRTKAFILNKEHAEYGGMYIWETQEDLSNFLATDAFIGSVEKFGDPKIQIFEVPAYIENKILL